MTQGSSSLYYTHALQLPRGIASTSHRKHLTHGTFLTFPALVFIGVPPVMANATSAVAVFPGYLGGALGFRKELQAFDRPTLLRLVVITLAGGLAGSLLLLVFFIFGVGGIFLFG